MCNCRQSVTAIPFPKAHLLTTKKALNKYGILVKTNINTKIFKPAQKNTQTSKNNTSLDGRTNNSKHKGQTAHFPHEGSHPFSPTFSQHQKTVKCVKNGHSYP